MDLAHVLYGSGGLLAVVAAAVVAPRLWRAVRRVVSVVDALAGRPARYEGDKEERPGLVQRLDHFDARLEDVHQQLTCLDRRVTRIEQATTGARNGEPVPRSPNSQGGV